MADAKTRRLRTAVLTCAVAAVRGFKLGYFGFVDGGSASAAVAATGTAAAVGKWYKCWYCNYGYIQNRIAAYRQISPHVLLHVLQRLQPNYAGSHCCSCLQEEKELAHLDHILIKVRAYHGSRRPFCPIFAARHCITSVTEHSVEDCGNILFSFTLNFLNAKMAISMYFYAKLNTPWLKRPPPNHFDLALLDIAFCVY
jgi:hypothetical protein